jgi:cytochrome d ubiquinol oxidase subunit II
MATVLQTLPLVFILLGLVVYTVLGGADFGAGIWQLGAGRDRRAENLREAAHAANAPVWEANHVWLIFVLTVLWTAYPVVFGSVMSTLAIPIFLALLGYILRALAYVLLNGTRSARERAAVETGFALASVLTPFMLGVALGSIAAGRVPPGNAAGDLVTSWVNPTSLVCGVLAVAVTAFLGAVYLAADATRLQTPELRQAFQRRALWSGVAAGILSVLGLVAVRADAPRLWAGLTSDGGAAATICCLLAGAAALATVAAGRFQTARALSTLAVAALLIAAALAVRPDILPGLTLAAAASDTATLVAVVLAVVLGALILAPSLALLFRLTLTGRLGPATPAASAVPVPRPRAERGRRPKAWQVAAACLVVAVLLLTIASADAAHVVGVLALIGAAIAAFLAVGPVETAAAAVADAPAEPPGPRADGAPPAPVSSPANSTSSGVGADVVRGTSANRGRELAARGLGTARALLNSWPVYRQVTGPDRLARGVATETAHSRGMRARTATADSEATSICPYCAVGCAQRAYVTDGQVVQIEGDPDSPISRGRLCPKGSASLQLVTGPQRVDKVRYRAPYADEWTDLDLDTAMDMITDRMLDARRRGWQQADPEGRHLRRTMGVAALGGATLDNEENYLFKKLWTAMGAVQIENQARV